MSVFEAIIQGIVQGATEFLPVSSSGHLSLAQHVLGVELDSLLFDILLHLGTLIAVIAVYYKLIIRLFSQKLLAASSLSSGSIRFSSVSVTKPVHAACRQILVLPHSGCGMSSAASSLSVRSLPYIRFLKL